MPNVLVSLNYVKQEDGTYRLNFPINTTNEVYYDIENNITLKQYLNSITPGGIIHVVETDDDRFALTTATVKYMDVVKVVNDKNTLYYVTDLDNLDNENGYTPFVDKDKFVLKEVVTDTVTTVNNVFISEIPTDSITEGDMTIDIPSGLEDGDVTMELTVKNTNTVNFEYLSEKSVEPFPDQRSYTKTLRSTFSPNGLYLYVEVSNSTDGKGIMYKVNGTKLQYMNTVITFTDLTEQRACCFSQDSKILLICKDKVINMAYLNNDGAEFYYSSTELFTLTLTTNSMFPVPRSNKIITRSATNIITVLDIAIDYSGDTPTVTLGDSTETVFPSAPSVVNFITTSNNYVVFVASASTTTGTSVTYIYALENDVFVEKGRVSTNSQIMCAAISNNESYLGVGCSNERAYVYDIRNLTNITQIHATFTNNGTFIRCAFTYSSDAFIVLGRTTSGTPQRRMMIIVDVGSTVAPEKGSLSASFVARATNITAIYVSPFGNYGFVLHDDFDNITPFTNDGYLFREAINSTHDSFIGPAVAFSKDGKYAASALPYGRGSTADLIFYSVKADGTVTRVANTTLELLQGSTSILELSYPTLYTLQWIEDVCFASFASVSGTSSVIRVVGYQFISESNSVIPVFLKNYTTYGPTKIIASEFIDNTAWLIFGIPGQDYIHMHKMTRASDGRISIEETRYIPGWSPGATIIDFAIYKYYMVVLYNASPYIKILKYTGTSNGYSIPETTYNSSLTLPSVPSSVQIDITAKRMVITYSNLPSVEVYNITEETTGMDYIFTKVDDTNKIGFPESVGFNWSKYIHSNKFILFCDASKTTRTYYLGKFLGNKLAIIKSGKLDDVDIEGTNPYPATINNTYGLFIDTDNNKPFGHMFKTSEVSATSTIKIEGRIDSNTNTWINANITSTNDNNIKNIYLSYNETSGRTCVVIVPKDGIWFDGFVSIDKITYQGSSVPSTGIYIDYSVSYDDFITQGDYTDLYEYIKQVESDVNNSLLNNKSIVTRDFIENFEIIPSEWEDKTDTLGYYVYKIKSDLITKTSIVLIDVNGVIGSEVANSGGVINNTTEYDGYTEIYSIDRPDASFFVNITIIN